MLLILLIGWTILLPALVVAGLYAGSSVLGRRRAALSAYEDLFAQDPLDGEDETERVIAVDVDETLAHLDGAARGSEAAEPGRFVVAAGHWPRRLST
jgi:hypothetical protein